MNWKVWLQGLIAAVVTAAANSVLLVLVNPGTFDVFSVAGWKNIGSVCTSSGLIAGAVYLKQQPLPLTSPSQGKKRRHKPRDKETLNLPPGS